MGNILAKEYFDRPCFCDERRFFGCLNTQSFCPAAVIETQWVTGIRLLDIDEEILKVLVKKIRKSPRNWRRTNEKNNNSAD